MAPGDEDLKPLLELDPKPVELGCILEELLLPPKLDDFDLENFLELDAVGLIDAEFRLFPNFALEAGMAVTVGVKSFLVTVVAEVPPGRRLFGV